MIPVFRALTARETECRIGRVTQYGVMVLLYKNARADMAILDEAVGAENWQREHYECKGNLYCRVGIRVERENGAEWVWKSDCGAESYTDKEKGESSDSFKRACVNWGIGRELYTAPNIFIRPQDCNITKEGKCNDKFYVREFDVKDGKITHVVIYNAAQNIRRNVYEYSKAKV